MSLYSLQITHILSESRLDQTENNTWVHYTCFFKFEVHSVVCNVVIFDVHCVPSLCWAVVAYGDGTRKDGRQVSV